MRKHNAALGTVIVIAVSLTLAVQATTVAAAIPDPEPVPLELQHTAFLKEELKHATSLDERRLIHDELMLAYLDALRELA